MAIKTNNMRFEHLLILLDGDIAADILATLKTREAKDLLWAEIGRQREKIDNTVKDFPMEFSCRPLMHIERSG